MSIWNKYTKEQQERYIKLIQSYLSLTNLFTQKKGKNIPYLDSKYQETVFARSFDSLNVDIGNTPHDVLSTFGNQRIGIGIKTWMNSTPSYQKVMQLKSYREDITPLISNHEALVHKISEIRNERVKSDQHRLGLSENDNIYHYITRDERSFSICECAYPLIDTSRITEIESSRSSIKWTDGLKHYKYTFSDSQIWQKFDSSSKNSLLLDKFRVKILQDPFAFLLESFKNYSESGNEEKTDIVEAYLPLYSYRTKRVERRSGLNAWNGAPKNKSSSTPRPLNEVYLPVPAEFHRKYPEFFVGNIFDIITERNNLKNTNKTKPEVRFHLTLPNGKRIPALLTGDNMKNFQSGSNVERDDKGVLYGQSALGQWLLVEVLGLRERKVVTLEWLEKKGVDSIRLWRKLDDFSNYYLDIAPFGAFERFMQEN